MRNQVTSDLGQIKPSPEPLFAQTRQSMTTQPSDFGDDKAILTFLFIALHQLRWLACWCLLDCSPPVLGMVLLYPLDGPLRSMRNFCLSNKLINSSMDPHGSEFLFELTSHA
mmetsp:Transcript_5171/g.11233  ORF Transcript_5171/g.11233 Transcript_5171/m.11233 type:complete len:112 (-) Transcript_5171:1362-1697(-)